MDESSEPWNDRRKAFTEDAKRKNKLEGAERSCRLNLRLTVAEKNKLLKKAATSRRTITSIISELIDQF